MNSPNIRLFLSALKISISPTHTSDIFRVPAYGIIAARQTTIKVDILISKNQVLQMLCLKLVIIMDKKLTKCMKI